VEQRTDDWFTARLGKVTASRVADVVAKTKSGYSTSRENYMAQLVCERLTGKPAEQYSNSAMQWGTDTEPLARAAYEARMDILVDEVGFIDHPSIVNSGASPDGLVGADGLIEIKCPNTSTHIDTLLNQAVPKKYADQIFWQMACTGRDWCDFVSYDPRLPPDLQLFIKRIPRDNQYIRLLESEVIEFLQETATKVAKLLNLKALNEQNH
jgi:putative phage-type endonuclease